MNEISNENNQFPKFILSATIINIDGVAPTAYMLIKPVDSHTRICMYIYADYAARIIIIFSSIIRNTYIRSARMSFLVANPTRLRCSVKTTFFHIRTIVFESDDVEGWRGEYRKIYLLVEHIFLEYFSKQFYTKMLKNCFWSVSSL